MLLEEMIQFVEHVRTRFSLLVQIERWFPDVRREVPPNASLKDEVRKFGHVDRMLLLYTPPRCRKPVVFTLNVGRQKGTRLDQSQFTGGSDNKDAFSTLKKIAAELKRRADPGVWIIMATGNVGYSKLERVSKGAAAGSRAGTLELGRGGCTVIYRMDKPE
jgi:hypothetical protein